MGFSGVRQPMKVLPAFLLCLFGLSTNSVISREGPSLQSASVRDKRSDSVESAPTAETPLELANAWLRFHETELCQSMDAEFRFSGARLEIWCRAEDGRSLEKAKEKLDTFFASDKIEIHAQPLPPEKKRHDDRNPPPSLWNNSELRSYLEDPEARDRVHFRVPERIAPPRDDDAETALKQRIAMFADQTLEWDKKLKRYAEDLPALMREATNVSASADLKARAAAVCLTHAQNLERLADKLEENLGHAFPRIPKHSDLGTEGDPDLGDSSIEAALQISDTGQSVARRIYLFIHPQQYTVGLMDLKEPPLLESLSRLRAMTRRFQSRLGKDWSRLGSPQRETGMSSSPLSSHAD